MKRCVPLLAAVFAAAWMAPARADEWKAKPVVVPCELLKTRHMAVQVRINGKGPYRLIFDTGAPVSLISNKVAKQTGLLKGAPPQSFLEKLLGGGGRPAKVEKLEVGTAKAADVPVIVMDHPTVALLASKLGPIEGIVGCSFFARHRMTIDYQAKQLTFTPNGYQPPDVMKGMMEAVQGLLNKKEPPAQVFVPAAQWGLRVAKAEGDDEAGVAIKEVMPGGAAAAAGLKAGDRLLTLDDRWTDSVLDCYVAVSAIKPGTAVKVTVQRGGKEMAFTVRPKSGL